MFHIFVSPIIFLQSHFLGQVVCHLEEPHDQVFAHPGDVAGRKLEVVEAIAVPLWQLPGVGVGDAQAAVPVVSGAARVPPPTITSF